MVVQYWLLKTEPEEWSWKRQEENGGVSHWDGVRNAQAQKHMRAMALGDLCLFYHTGKSREVVGTCCVVRTAYPDPSDPSAKHCMLDIAALSPFPRPVTLVRLKQDPSLVGLVLLRQPRLSVVPIAEHEWTRICQMAEENSGGGEEEEEEDGDHHGMETEGDDNSVEKRNRPRDKKKPVDTAAEVKHPNPKRNRRGTETEGESNNNNSVEKQHRPRDKKKPMDTAAEVKPSNPKWNRRGTKAEGDNNNNNNNSVEKQRRPSDKKKPAGIVEAEISKA